MIYQQALFFLGEAAMAVRQQLSSMLYVRNICKSQIKNLKTGDIDTSVLHPVSKPNKFIFLLFRLI